MGARGVCGDETKGSCLSAAKGFYDWFFSEDGFSSKALNTHSSGCFLSAGTKALNISAGVGGGEDRASFSSCFPAELPVGITDGATL